MSTALPHNRDELRRRRLAALDPSFEATTTTITTSSSSSSSSSPREPPSKKPKVVVSSSSSPDVVDLCGSSSDENDDNDDDGVVVVRTRKGRGDTKPSASRGSKSLSTTALSDTDSNVPWQGRFQVCSYNLWFGRGDGGYPHPQRRMTALVDTLLDQHQAAENPLWFVGFQENMAPLAAVIGPRLEQAGYRVVFQQPLLMGYGVGLAIHTEGPSSPVILESGWRPFAESRMDRGFVYARCRLPSSNEQCLVTTTHLESWISAQETGAACRAQQVAELEAFCNRQMKQHASLVLAIISGDLNWDDASRKPLDATLTSLLQLSSWTDAFLATRASTKDMGYTYDSKLNAMLGGNLRRRFDRCLVRTRGSPLQAVSTNLIGTQPIPNLTWEKRNPYNGAVKQAPTLPSDHFGLLVQFSTEEHQTD